MWLLCGWKGTVCHKPQRQERYEVEYEQIEYDGYGCAASDAAQDAEIL